MKNQTVQIKQGVVYAMVSAPDKGQDPENRLPASIEYAAKGNFEVIGKFRDYTSATSQHRTRHKLIIAAAKKRKLDMALTGHTAAPTAARITFPTQVLVNAVKEFQSTGINLISYQRNIDIITQSDEFIFHVIASLALFESSLINQSLKAGMVSAKNRANNFPDHSYMLLTCTIS